MIKKFIKAIIFLISVLITSILLIFGWMYFAPFSSYNQSLRETVVLEDFWLSIDSIESKELINKLQDIAKKSKDTNNKISAIGALMTIYHEGMKGESKNARKFNYWCNELTFFESGFTESSCYKSSSPSK